MTTEPTYEETKASDTVAESAAAPQEPAPDIAVADEPADAEAALPYIEPNLVERETTGFVEAADRPRDALTAFTARNNAVPEEPKVQPKDSIFPSPPLTLADLGLSKAFLTDLALKILHYSGTPTISQMTRRLGLPANIMQQLVTALTEERLVEVLSQSDLYTGNYRYRLSERGSARVTEALERSRYAGPAPVTAEQYNEVLRRIQSRPHEPNRGSIKSLLNELTLGSDVADSMARALYSGKAAIVYGASGNGKTVILERYAQNQDGIMLVPYAIYAFGQVIRVFDQSVHEPIVDEARVKALGDCTRMDERWVLIKRPAILLGAEMGRESLDLAYDPLSRFYQAPPHIKAQGGVLIVDDFGRQAVPSRDLLTRWLIPLERGWDTLSMATGEKLTVPFRAQLLFGTNLPVKKVADDALLRRVLYKVEVPSPKSAEFTEILRQVCREKGVLVSDGALEYVSGQLYSRDDIKVRGSYARDLLEMLIQSAAFDGRSPVLDKESFDRVFKLFIAHETEEAEDDQA